MKANKLKTAVLMLALWVGVLGLGLGGLAILEYRYAEIDRVYGPQ